jgi:hypothetical protein
MRALRARRHKGIERFEGIALTEDEVREIARAGYTRVLGDGTPAVQALNKFIPTRSPASTAGMRP